jgi:ubiquinone/menaquinone biosynthesis C-methylase UbiE
MDDPNPNRRAATAKVEFFDRFARQGDVMRLGPADEPKLARLQARLGDLRGLRVLEPGCGAGSLTTWLSRWVGPGGRVEAFDPSGEMLALCRQAVAAQENVRLTQVRCEDAVFPDGAFDRVICFRVLPHFDDIDAALGRFARWLRPGGRLHIVHWEGRAALAEIHGNCEPLAVDVLPPPTQLTAALERSGFTLVAATDNAQEIYLEAVRP